MSRSEHSLFELMLTFYSSSSRSCLNFPHSYLPEYFTHKWWVVLSLGKWTIKSWAQKNNNRALLPCLTMPLRLEKKKEATIITKRNVYSTTAYLIQTVFTVRLRINFHFHHHRIRTSNVAQHFVRVSCKSLVCHPFKKKIINQFWSPLENSPPTSSPRHFLSPSSLCGESEKPPAVGYINEMPCTAPPTYSCPIRARLTPSL